MQTKIKGLLASNWFLGIIIALFAAEAIWLALNSRFQMAFDEGYHFGLIQFFSHHLNPIIGSQPSDTYKLGAIVHNGSFLYHYLLSFPYRLISSLTDSLKTVVISLRLLNICLAIANLLIIKKLLQELKLPKALANLIVFAFAFTPMVSVLAAQINYDNLLLPMISLTILLTVRFMKSLNQPTFHLQLLLAIFLLCLFSSLVKFEFLPVFAGVIAVISFECTSRWRHNRASGMRLLKDAYRRLSGRRKFAWAASISLGLGLFTTYYGVNVVKYRNPVPACHQVLSVKACSHYYAWDRNYTLATHKPANLTYMPVFSYVILWAKEMYYQIFAEIVPSGGLIYIQPSFKLIVFFITATGGVSVLLSWRRLLSQRLLVAAGLISLVYLLVLLSRNYHDYHQLGAAVAIQGRYLLPVLPYLYALAGVCIYYVFHSRRTLQRIAQPIMVGFVLFSFLIWGGYSRYIQTISPTSGWADNPKLTSRS